MDKKIRNKGRAIGKYYFNNKNINTSLKVTSLVSSKLSLKIDM